MSQDLGIVGTVLSFPGAALSTASQGISNAANIFIDYTVSPVLNGISSATIATSGAINACIIKPIVVVAKAVDDFVLAIHPFLAITAAIGGTACLAKGVYDFKNPKVTDKTSAEQMMGHGATSIFLSICIAANPYIRSFFSKKEILEDTKTSPFIDAIPLALHSILIPIFLLALCSRAKKTLVN